VSPRDARRSTGRSAQVRSGGVGSSRQSNDRRHELNHPLAVDQDRCRHLASPEQATIVALPNVECQIGHRPAPSRCGLKLASLALRLISAAILSRRWLAIRHVPLPNRLAPDAQRFRNRSSAVRSTKLPDCARLPANVDSREAVNERRPSFFFSFEVALPRSRNDYPTSIRVGQ